MATDPAASPTGAPTEAAMMTLDRRDGSATIDLYRAALGPVHADYYLKAFTRFDAAGRPGLSWNWRAALLTLNWLLFRQLWLPALSYVGALAATVLLFGIGRLLFQLSDASQWALGGLAFLVAFVIPGARGNAWLYASCNKKMERALAASASLEDACTLLAQRATGRKHQIRLAAGNLAVFGAVAAVMLVWPEGRSLPRKSPAVPQARLAPAEAAVPPVPTVSAAPAATASAAVVAASAPAVPGRTSQGHVLAAAPAPMPAPVASAVAASAPAPVVAAEPAKVSRAEKRAQTLLEKKQKLALAKEAKEANEAKEAPLAKEAKPAMGNASAPASTGIYQINVGLFADANNARNAYAKLKDAGLPATTQELKSAKGQVRTRVRVGPFDSQAEADTAAEKIRALKLDAAVVKP